MAGEVTVVHLPFAGGVEEKIAAQYLDASSKQTSVLNGDFVKIGVIDKRAGIAHVETSLIDGGPLLAPASGTRVVGWSRSALSLLCDSGLYQYVRAPVGGAADGGLVGIGQLPAVGVLRRPIVTGDQGAAPVLCDLTFSGQPLRIAVFYDSEYNVLASVSDVSSGSLVLSPTRIYTNSGSLAAATIPSIIAAFDLPGIADGNPRSLIAIHDNDDGTVRYVQYDPGSNSFTSPTTLVATVANVVDVAPYEDDPDNGWFVLYDVGGTPPAFGGTVRLAYWTTAGLQTTVDQAIAGGHTLGFGAYVCGRFGESVWAVWKTTSGGSLTHYWAQRREGASFATATTPFMFQQRTTAAATYVPTGTAYLSADKLFVTFHYEDVGSPGPTTFMSAWRVLSHSAGTVSNFAFGRIPLGLLPATRPFIVDGEVYQAHYFNLQYSAGGVTDPCRQITLFLSKFFGVSASMSAPFLGLQLTDICRPFATVAPRIASHTIQGTLDLFGGGFHTGFPSSVDRNATRLAVGLKTLGPAGETVYQLAGPSWSVDFFWDQESRRDLFQTSELGSELSISGGVPFISDGQSAFEDVFFNYPELSHVALEGSGTPLATGQYTFAVVYRSIDSAGLVHRSAPFICSPTSVTSGGAGPALYITPPISSYRDALATSTSIGKIWADVYMTETDGGTLYFKDSLPVSNTYTGLSFSPWPTSIRYPESGQVTSEPDTTGPLLPTTGGVLDHVCPPASKIQITHQKRKAVVDETLRGVHFSTQFVEGEAPGFNEALYVPFPEGGDITALGSLEGKFFAFKKNSIWFMEGNGPSATGLGASWTDPEPLTTDVGAKSWRSVVATSDGLMFQAPDNGIYLLGRDLQVSFVGKSVVDTTDAYPNVVSATLVPFSDQVRFVCLDEAGENHIVIVYDYLLGQWTTHRYDRISDIPASACLSSDSPPRFTVLTADGELWQERPVSDPARCMDQDSGGTNHFVPTTIRVPAVKMQVVGYQKARRVQFFGEQQDDCGLQIQMAFNYDDTVRQTATWTSADLSSLNVRGQVETFVGNAYNKQMSMQLTISDTEGDAMTTGAGMRFVSTAIELVNLGPQYKLLSSRARR